MLIVFFDCHGIGNHECVPEGQTIDVAFYVEVSERLCVAWDKFVV